VAAARAGLPPGWAAATRAKKARLTAKKREIRGNWLGSSYIDFNPELLNI
jgi:hypothetical protein